MSEEKYGTFKYLGSAEIKQSLSKAPYAKQTMVIRQGIQKVINERIVDEAGSTTGSDFSPNVDHADFIGETTIETNHESVQVTIEKDMIRVITESGSVHLCHHFNTISISMCDNTISNIFCYLANGSIRTKNQDFETVSNPNRQLYIFQCETTGQSRTMARAMDRKFKPKRCQHDNVSFVPPCRTYLAPVGSDKVLIPSELLVSDRH